MKRKTLDTFLQERGTQSEIGALREIGVKGRQLGKEKRTYTTERQKLEERRMLEIATRKANGLARLEIALTKYLCDQHGQQKEAVSAAIMRCREAQQDADFADLWQLLEEAGANTNWP